MIKETTKDEKDLKFPYFLLGKFRRAGNAKFMKAWFEYMNNHFISLK